MNAPELYEIRIEGHLGETWAARFETLRMRLDQGGQTVLSGALDQAALHGVLISIRDLGLKLVSVNRHESDATALTNAHDHCAPLTEAGSNEPR